MLTGGAHASSFVIIDAKAPKSTPSIVSIGAATSFVTMLEQPKPEPAAASIVPLAFPLPEDRESTTVSPSIVAFESITPDIAYEEVAAIKPDHVAPKPFEMSTPMVMRGGIIGDAFSSAPAEESRPVPATSSAASSRRGGRSREEPPQEEVAPAPVPPSKLPKLGAPL